MVYINEIHCRIFTSSCLSLMMKLCNIKISLYFDRDFYEKKRCNEKIITRVKNWTFTQYLHSPKLVNATGLKSSKDIQKIISFWEEKYNVKCLEYKVDSCMLSHKDSRVIKLEKVEDILPSITKKYYIDFNPEIFCGMYLKPFDRLFPTINLFYTGSYQLIGGHYLENIEESLAIVKKLLQQL